MVLNRFDRWVTSTFSDHFALDHKKIEEDEQKVGFLKSPPDCTACRLVSGGGLIGFALAFFYQTESNAQEYAEMVKDAKKNNLVLPRVVVPIPWKTAFMRFCYLTMFGLGCCRLADIDLPMMKKWIGIDPPKLEKVDE